MSDAATVEDRLTALESAVEELRQQLRDPPKSSDWMREIMGSFKDEPAFAEVIEYGRAFRESQPPPEDPGP
jgi:hypothetical protein